MNLSTKQTQRHKEQTCHCQEGGGGEGKDWDFGISRYKLLYIECKNNKVLQYNTGNYIQYPVINYNRKDCGKECVYICVTESYCCVAETNTALYTNYT